MNNFRPVYLSLMCRSNQKLSKQLEVSKRQWSNKVKKGKKVDSNETIPPPERLKKQYKDPSILELIPRQLLRRGNKTNSMYLVTESNTPNKIANYLGSLPNLSIPFVETNPGPGLLTKLLLQSGIKDLRIFEAHKEFMTHLQDAYANVYPDRIKLKKADIFSLNKFAYQDRYDNVNRVEGILSGLPVTKWEDDINFRLYGATEGVTFFKYLTHSIILQRGILSCGRCELYMVMPAFTYIQLTCSNQAGYMLYRPTSIFFQILFEYELLDKFPRMDFLPHPSCSNFGKHVYGKTQRIDQDLAYLVKIVPRRNLYQFGTEKDIQHMWHFIQMHCVSRKNRIIPSLERQIPSSGTRLLLNTNKSIRSRPIKETHLHEIPPLTNPSMTLSDQDYYDDINIYTQFGDLTPSQLFTLFHQFRSWPEYSSSTFHASLESLLVKMTTPPYERNEKPESNLEEKEDVIESNEVK